MVEMGAWRSPSRELNIFNRLAAPLEPGRKMCSVPLQQKSVTSYYMYCLRHTPTEK